MTHAGAEIHTDTQPTGQDLLDASRVLTLTGPPAVGRLLARAAVTAIAPSRRGHSVPVLPDYRVDIVDQYVDLRQWANYAAVCAMSLGNQVPGSFVHAMTFGAQVAVMSDPAFPFPMMGMVHVGNHMQTLNPVRVDQPITLSAWAQSLRRHPHGVTIDLHGHASSDGEVMWRGTSTYLVRSVDPQTVPREPDQAAGEIHMQGGAMATWAHWPLAADLGRRYAAVSGDRNPIHLNPLAAKTLGFRRTIAHGMWTQARVLGALEGRVPTRHTVSVRFRSPILLPSTVAFRACAVEAGHEFAVTDAGGDRQHVVGRITAQE